MSSYQRHRRRRGKKRSVGKGDAVPRQNSDYCDYHHMVGFQGRHWNQGYAKLIRNHPYAGAKIPMRTLHREIHSKIHDVPRPKGDICKRTYQKLVSMCKSGQLSPKYDSPEQKLQFFIDEWEECCPATAEILRWEKQIIHKYYAKRGGAKMKNETRWKLEANIVYESESARNETYADIVTNGVYPYQVSGEGLTLVVNVPSVNSMIFMRLSEILTRYNATESSIQITRVDNN